jgi:hypothetical protein
MTRKLSKAWNEEFELMKAMQEDRMHMFAAQTCQERCVSHFMTNGILFNEATCMRNCLDKHSQIGIITNLNYSKYEEEALRSKKKK